MDYRKLLVAVALTLQLGCSTDLTAIHSSQKVDITTLAIEARSEAARSLAQGLAGSEEQRVALDDEIGGYGGSYRSRSGELVVNLVEGVSDETGVQAVMRHASARSESPVAEPKAVRVRRVKYRFSEVVAMKHIARRLVAADAGFVYLDADEREAQLDIGVKDADAAARVRRRLLANGLAADGFRITLSEPIQQLGSIRDHFRPTGAGMQIRARYNTLDPNAWRTCTMGFNVTDSVGTRYALTAAHCVLLSNEVSIAEPGATMYVSNPIEGSSSNQIGYYAIRPMWWREDCGTGISVCLKADAMLMRYHANVESPKRIIHTNSSGGAYAQGTLDRSTGMVWNTVNNAYVPFLDDTLHKVGRTTGWTTGVVVAECVDFASRPQWLVLCNDAVEAWADEGDSGAPVFYRSWGLPSSVRVPAGILHSGKPMPELGPSVKWYYFSNRWQINQEFGMVLNY